MILKLFAFWRIGLFVLTFLGTKIIPPASNGALGSPTISKPFDYWLSWAQWDGGFYYNIASRGYILLQDYAFFPLFPSLVAIVRHVTQLNLLASGLIVSNVATIGFLVVFYKYLKEKYSKETALSTLVTFLCFPTAFFTVAYYTEGLFLLLAASTFYFLHKGKLVHAALVIALASLTKIIGAILVLSIFYSYAYSISFSLKKITTKALTLAMSLIGVATYTLFLFYKTNTPFAFVNIQSQWQRNISDPVSTIASYALKFLADPTQPTDQYFDFAVTVFFLAVLILGMKRISSSLWIFSILVILIPASTGTLTSMSRYALSSLGAFIVIGSYLNDHPKLKIPVWTASLILQVILAVRFISGYWVA